LKKKGFKYDVEFEASDEIEEGYVIETKPSAGSSKKKGSIIIIVESTGTEDVILKDYTDQDVETLKEKLESSGLEVIIEKKEVDDAKNYIGKADVVIDQNPKFNEEEEITLKEGDEIILYVPDVLVDYPDMVGEGWTLSKVEEFANKYGLTLIVKDSKNNTITDYSNYLDSMVSSQNRTGKIASGVAFTVTINVDMSTYNLVINYLNKRDNSSIYDSKTEKKKNGDVGSVTCPGKAGYTTERSSIGYEIDGEDVTINCYYTENIVNDDFLNEGE